MTDIITHEEAAEIAAALVVDLRKRDIDARAAGRLAAYVAQQTRDADARATEAADAIWATARLREPTPGEFEELRRAWASGELMQRFPTLSPAAALDHVDAAAEAAP